MRLTSSWKLIQIAFNYSSEPTNKRPSLRILAGGPLTVTEVALIALMKTMLASGVFWLFH